MSNAWKTLPDLNVSDPDGEDDDPGPRPAQPRRSAVGGQPKARQRMRRSPIGTSPWANISTTGDPPQLARLVRTALEESKTPFDIKPPAGAGATNLGVDFDTAKVDAAIGHKGKANGGVYQFGIRRADSIKMDGMAVPGAMGTAIGINFQPTGNGKAAITGDFVALSSELNPVIIVLRDSGLEVTAIHNHMVGEEPRAFFVHFWANDDALKLANGLGAALETVAVVKQ